MPGANFAALDGCLLAGGSAHFGHHLGSLMKRTILGIVHSRTQAEALLDRLQSAGISREEISLLLPDRAEKIDAAHTRETKATHGAIAGAGTGGALGGILGLLGGMGILAMPGLGVLLAAGPLLGVLGGIVVGATVGGILGTLVGMRVPLRRDGYAKQRRRGDVVIATHVNDEEQPRALEAYKKAGADRVSSLTDDTESWAHHPS